MADKAHNIYLEALKDWLRKSRLPGDREKLRKTLGVLERLEVPINTEERAELRGLLKDCFALGDTELDSLLPAAEDLAPMMGMVGGIKRPFPELPGYVGAYLKITKGQESPDSFHALALMTCVGAALGRQVWIDKKFFKVRPNMSVILTGPAGGPKKTTAWEMAMSATRSAMRGHEMRVISDASPQALVEELARDQEDAIGMIWAPEFRNFFPSSKYMEGAVPLITRLLDDPETYPVARITRRVTNIKNVTLAMAGGSTLDWLAKMPEDSQGGGFWTRVLIAHEENGKEKQPNVGGTAGAALVRDLLCAISRYGVGEVRLDPGADAWFEKWYESTKVAKNLPPRLRLFYNRKQIHLLRLAMVMHMPVKVLRRQDLEKALELLDWIEQPMADVYRLIGMSKNGEIVKSVLDVLMAAGGVMDFEKLAREMKGRLNSRDLQTALETLRQAGQIKEIKTLMEHKVVVKEVGAVE